MEQTSLSFTQALQCPITQSKYHAPPCKLEMIEDDLDFSIDVLRHTMFKSWALQWHRSSAFMNDFHVLLHLNNERNSLHAWTWEGKVVARCQFWMFNWSLDFDVQKVPFGVAKSLYLPGLPLQLYRLDFL